VKKTLAILGVVLMTVLGIGGGLGMALAPTANEQQAQAGFNLFDFNTWFCQTKDDPQAPLGGSNDMINAAFSGSVTSPAAGGFLNVPEESGKKTPLEIYGYYAPTYNAWTGLYPGDEKDKAAIWAGTGGKAGVTSEGKKTPYVYGPTYSINDPLFSPLYSAGGFCANVVGNLTAGVGNTISYIPKLAVAISGEVYDWATTTTLTDKKSALYPVAKGVETLIIGTPGQPGLKDLLFLDFLTPIVLVATGWFILNGLIRRRSIETAQGAIWMILAACGALLFLTMPLKVAEGVDTVVSTVNSAVVGAINDTGNTGDYCQLPSNADDKDTRVIKCSLWYSLIYAPWVNGQFGYDQYNLPAEAKSDVVTSGPSTGTSKVSNGVSEKPDGTGWDEAEGKITVGSVDNSRGILKVDSYEDKYRLQNTSAMLNWPYYQMHISSGYEPYIGLNYSEVAFNQLAVNGNTSWKDASGAVGSAVTSLLATIAPVAVLMSMSLTILAYQIMMLLLIAFSPLFFLIGVAPGWGRRIAMRWIELVVGLLVKRIMLVMFLAIYLRLLMTVLGIPGMNWLLQMTLVAILSVVALTQRSTFVDIISDMVDFGGEKRIGDDSQIKDKARVATGKAYSAGSAVVRRGAVAAAPAARKVGASVKQTTMSGADTLKGRLAKDAKLGIDVAGSGAKGAGSKKVVGRKQDPLAALANVNSASDIKVDRLRKAELEKISNADGTLDQKRADKWIQRTKVKHVAEQKAIDNEYKQNVAERKRIVRGRGMNPFERSKALEDNRRQREELRRRQAEQNKEIRRVFGDKEIETKSRKDPLATRYKAPKRYRQPTRR
jgi:hypothetical protein